MIDRLQPYNNGDRAHEHPLAVLAAYSNEDKHRSLVATAVLATSVRFKMTHNAPGPFLITGYQYRSTGSMLYSGADLGSVIFTEGSIYDGVVVEPRFEGRIVFGMQDDTVLPFIDVTSLEEVLYALHTEVVAPLDEILYG